ncbi:MAG: hypothetical protein M3373_12730 [Gemmatimonadota bacterium]|nr:hypothetical protein [Gemmatimonadota bacterium]
MAPSKGGAGGHTGLAAGRWKSLTLIEQLANVGSEVDRAIKAHEAGRPDRRDAAVDRGLELFDLTAADGRWRGARRREVLRAREEFCALFWGDDRPGAAASLSKYFLHFALAARRAAGRG